MLQDYNRAVECKMEKGIWYSILAHGIGFLLVIPYKKLRTVFNLTRGVRYLIIDQMKNILMVVKHNIYEDHGNT